MRGAGAQRGAVWLLVLLLAGCASRGPAPIEDRTAAQGRASAARADAARGYVVVRGDTLYSIAWRYQLDYRDLAAANGIAPPYLIYPGQRLRLASTPMVRASVPSVPASAQTRPGAAAAPPPARPVEQAPRAPATAAPSVATGAATGAAGTTRTDGVPPVATAPREAPAASAGQPPAPSANPAAQRPPPTPAPASTQVAAPAAGATAEGPVKAWRWPATGPVVRGFSAELHKGIDLGGERGDPVVAAAPGTVVYAGSGISGYGELLIIRHNRDTLSAYGHNDRLLVGEGEQVAAGQRIATRGSSGTNSVKLHFEIRRNGKPIDPLSQLPRR